MSKKLEHVVTFRVDDSTYQALKDLAKIDDRSISWVARDILETWLYEASLTRMGKRFFQKLLGPDWEKQILKNRNLSVIQP